MEMNDANLKKHQITLFLFALSLYVLEGVLVNPMIAWTALPVVMGYVMIGTAWRKQSHAKLCEAYGFLIFSMGFTFLYHLAWFFDWGGTKTGSSTSALIFAVFPVYAIIIGGAGYLFGKGMLKPNKGVERGSDKEEP